MEGKTTEGFNLRVFFIHLVTSYSSVTYVLGYYYLLPLVFLWLGSVRIIIAFAMENKHFNDYYNNTLFSPDDITAFEKFFCFVCFILFFT